MEKLNLGITKLIPIYIRMLTGESLQLDITTIETVKSLKEKINQKIGILVSEQRLIFEGKEIEDSHMLSDYNIKSNSNI